MTHIGLKSFLDKNSNFHVKFIYSEKATKKKTNFDFTHFYDFSTNQPFYTKMINLIVEKNRKNEIDCSHLVNNLAFFVIVTDIYYQLLDYFAYF